MDVRTPLLLFLLLGLGRDLAGLEGRGLARIHDISQVVAGQLRVVRDDLARQRERPLRHKLRQLLLYVVRCHVVCKHTVLILSIMFVSPTNH